MWIYRGLDAFFFVFHTGLVLFVLVGWLPRRTRLAHLVVVVLTGLSWFGLGLWYGIGYCPSTQWHWQVRQRLGYGEMSDSYLKFVFDRLTGLDANRAVVDAVAFGSFLAVAVVSLALNVARLKVNRS
ncbi:MAG TPA: DUF2784 family protein [Candidatus Bathyarchaeia archaeon]|nr:DUF2784 family protein [Candidatus Bathyarchaeia archaeon]